MHPTDKVQRKERVFYGTRIWGTRTATGSSCLVRLLSRGPASRRLPLRREVSGREDRHRGRGSAARGGGNRTEGLWEGCATGSGQWRPYRAYLWLLFGLVQCR